MICINISITVIILPCMETHIAWLNTRLRCHRWWTPSLSLVHIPLLRYLASIAHFLGFSSIRYLYDIKKNMNNSFSVLMYYPFFNTTSLLYLKNYLTLPPITEKSVISGAKPSLLRSQQCTVLESWSQVEFLISFNIFL